jgi:ribA/ribD-fused uncharacterized protein
VGGKEHGLYVSSTPSSAARKAVTKLLASNKSKKVEFCIREITQGSKKKTYGTYIGYIEKLKKPIELKGRVIKYKPVVKLSGKTGAKKGGMYGGEGETEKSIFFISTSRDYNFLSNFYICSFEDKNELMNGNPIQFKNMEQYFIYKKAKKFDPENSTLIKAILQQVTPKEIQKLGRSVKKFNEEEWNKVKLEIMYDGLKLKFGQNPELKQKLLETGNKILYEANKYDDFWGIGKTVEEGIKMEKEGESELFGKNQLGELLMALRGKFAREKMNENYNKTTNISNFIK